MSGLGAMMAGGNPATKRQKDDFYPTPPDVVMALPDLPGQCVWEPCAGDGTMVDAIKARFGCPVLATDIAPRRADISPLDFLQTVTCPADTIITNPPFNLAEPIIRHAFRIGVTTMALVLKSTFWHAARRQNLFRDHTPSQILPLTWRPDFLGLGAPTMEVSWCIWEQGKTGTVYRPLARP